MAILVTGGAGFIGSNFIIDWFQHSNEPVINYDKLSYAGNLNNIKALYANPFHFFIRGDIRNHELIHSLLTKHAVRAVIHFAAESHVDRSIQNPNIFIETNIVGTFQLLQTVQHYWHNLSQDDQAQFRFIHISTDEVFGSLAPAQAAFTELNRYEPNSPYSASKAAADHLVRAFFHTYGLPVITTHCSNNYGPHQLPEKLIPLAINMALNDKPIPLYGDGQQIRDWLYVKDHCRGIFQILKKGQVGEVYNIGGWNEKTNEAVVRLICHTLDRKRPRRDKRSYVEQITYVTDRAGHDKRYAIDASKMKQMLGWQPIETFDSGLEHTVDWYLNNPNWFCQSADHELASLN